MKRSTSLLLFHALLSVVSGILITQMSLLGRIGIHTMYRQFMVFRSWWKTALLLFAAQCLLLGLLWGVRKMANLSVAKKNRMATTYCRYSRLWSYLLGLLHHYAQGYESQIPLRFLPLLDWLVGKLSILYHH